MRKLSSVSLLMILAFTLVACAPKTKDSQYREIHWGVETDYASYDFKELSDASELVVMAKLKEESKPFLVKPYGGEDPSVYRDLTFEIKEIYKGDLKDKNTIMLRLLGGEITDEKNKTIYIQEANEPEFHHDKDYILFLTRPKVDPYKTEEDYYTLIAGTQSVFEAEFDQIVNIEDPKINYERSELDTIDPSIDPDAVTKNEMDMRLKEGEITQEEYDQYFESLNHFGKRID